MDEETGSPARQPFVLSMDDPELSSLVSRLAAGGALSVLGGTMSRNIHLVDAGVVLRVHAPFVTPTRVLAERRLKQTLLDAGLLAAKPRRFDGRELVAVAGRVAEVEQYVPHQVPAPGWDAYRTMFATLCRIHGALKAAELPRPRVSTYGAPGTLRRHLGRLSLRSLSSRSRQHIREISSVLRAVEKTWVPARELPTVVVHGDPRLENLPAGRTAERVVLDLGFAARRPRIHDLAYASAWILLGPDDAGIKPVDAATGIRSCISTYEEEAGALTPIERRAFDGYLAGVCLYQGIVAAHLPDPDAHLAGPGVRQLIEIAREVTTQPATFT